MAVPPSRPPSPWPDSRPERPASPGTAPALAPIGANKPVPPRRGIGHHLARSWPLWSLGVITLVGGVGVVSAMSLFRIPNLPNCRAMFWPTAAASTRIQCAQAFADQGTVTGYLEAITLVEQLPPDHPLRAEIDRSIEAWAEGILNLAEDTFQAGQLSEAIAMAKRIPHHTAAAAVVNERVGRWQQIWEDGEAIHQAATRDLNNQAFQDAFRQAIRLRDLDNVYWQTVKYDELTSQITAARQDLDTLGKAKAAARRRTVASLSEALTLAQGIASTSPLYSEARTLMRQFSWDLLGVAETALEDYDPIAAQRALAAIPADMNMQAEIADMGILIEASQLAAQGGVIGLEGAIVRLQSIGQDRPLYGRAQAIMGRWQAEVAGRSRLEWARQLALPGTVAALQAAIAEASQVERTNPAWEDTQTQIDRWQRSIQIAEDRPIVQQADQLAQEGDLAGAIAVLQQVPPGRALSDEATETIARWRTTLQTTEDRPLLSQAQGLARRGDLQQAIQVASRIGANRALYPEAQADIADWRSTLQRQQAMQEAYRVAQGGTPAALAQAIDLAQAVPTDSPDYGAAIAALTQWSWDILRLAETEARYDLNRAIDVASAVPPRTEAYARAQLLIQQWQTTLNPAMPNGVDDPLAL